MKNTIKVARLDINREPVYDCTVFAVDGTYIDDDIHIVGDFICGKHAVIGSVFADGIAVIGEETKAVCIYAGEGIYTESNIDAWDLVSPEDIEVGDNATLCDVIGYKNVKIGDNAITAVIEAWTGDSELGQMSKQAK